MRSVSLEHYQTTAKQSLVREATIFLTKVAPARTPPPTTPPWPNAPSSCKRAVGDVA